MSLLVSLHISAAALVAPGVPERHGGCCQLRLGQPIKHDVPHPSGKPRVRCAHACVRG